jgi:outer membrane protein OmpA-like peptidoglycan-associated protein
MVHFKRSLVSAASERRVVFLLVALLVGLWQAVPGRAVDATALDSSLVVYFDQNSAEPPAAEQHKIRDLLQRIDTDDPGKIFVIGYTDGVGSQAYNAELARKRADAVRRIMIDITGLSPDRIITLGKGSKQPGAANTLSEGRARHRRAEIYFSRVMPRAVADHPEPAKPSPAVITLLEEADKALRLNRLDTGFAKLQAARALGGERTARWNLLQGIAAYYAARPADQVRPYLQTALHLEPHQGDAREYLGRLEAREQVKGGRVSAVMGQRPETAITVASTGEMFEYLRLFNVKALSRQQVPGHPILVWECRDPHGGTVFYHFDCSGVYDWAFVKQTSAQAEADVPGSNTSLKHKKSSRRIPFIWEAELYR